MRKVIQICCGTFTCVEEPPTVDNMLYALCDDGSIWIKGDHAWWGIQDVPQDAPQDEPVKPL